MAATEQVLAVNVTCFLVLNFSEKPVTFTRTQCGIAVRASYTGGPSLCRLRFHRHKALSATCDFHSTSPSSSQRLSRTVQVFSSMLSWLHRPEAESGNVVAERREVIMQSYLFGGLGAALKVLSHDLVTCAKVAMSCNARHARTAQH